MAASAAEGDEWDEARWEALPKSEDGSVRKDALLNGSPSKVRVSVSAVCPAPLVAIAIGHRQRHCQRHCHRRRYRRRRRHLRRCCHSRRRSPQPISRSASVRAPEACSALSTATHRPPRSPEPSTATPSRNLPPTRGAIATATTTLHTAPAISVNAREALRVRVARLQRAARVPAPAGGNPVAPPRLTALARSLLAPPPLSCASCTGFVAVAIRLLGHVAVVARRCATAGPMPRPPSSRMEPPNGMTSPAWGLETTPPPRSRAPQSSPPTAADRHKVLVGRHQEPCAKVPAPPT